MDQTKQLEEVTHGGYSQSNPYLMAQSLVKRLAPQVGRSTIAARLDPTTTAASGGGVLPPAVPLGVTTALTGTLVPQR